MLNYLYVRYEWSTERFQAWKAISKLSGASFVGSVELPSEISESRRSVLLAENLDFDGSLQPVFITWCNNHGFKTLLFSYESNGPPYLSNNCMPWVLHVICCLVKHDIEASLYHHGGLVSCDAPYFPVIFFITLPFEGLKKLSPSPVYHPTPPHPPPLPSC